MSCEAPPTEAELEAELQRKAQRLAHHFWRLKQDVKRVIQQEARHGANLANISWLFRDFDTDGEVTFAGVGESVNQHVEQARSIDRG